MAGCWSDSEREGPAIFCNMKIANPGHYRPRIAGLPANSHHRRRLNQPMQQLQKLIVAETGLKTVCQLSGEITRAKHRKPLTRFHASVAGSQQRIGGACLCAANQGGPWRPGQPAGPEQPRGIREIFGAPGRLHRSNYLNMKISNLLFPILAIKEPKRAKQ